MIDSKLSQPSVGGATVEAIDLQPAQQLEHILIVVVNEGLAAYVEAALGQLVESIGDAQQRVALAKLQECPWPAAVLRRHPPSATDAARVSLPRLERQQQLNTYVVLPAIGEVVLVHTKRS